MLASAGFPAHRLSLLRDDDLAEAADSLGDGYGAARDRYAAAYARARRRLSTAISQLAAEPRFREAVAWQEPAMFGHLDEIAAGRRIRGYEPAVVRHLQRYCLSSQTLGFFGPVGWAQAVQDDIGLAVTPGSGQLSRRTTYFEWQAMDVLAGSIAARPEVAAWLTPRRAPSAAVDRGMLLLPFRVPVLLTDSAARMLGLCDGTRTIRALAGDPPDPGSLAALHWLGELGAVQIGLHVPVSARPERELADLVRSIAAPEVRGPALEQIARLVAGKDAVRAAAGDAARVHRATTALTQAYQRVIGAPAVRGGRGGGAAPAARPLVYEDAVRDVQVRVGRRLTDMLAAPMCLMLDSAAWLVNSIAARYQASFWRTAAEARKGNGASGVPLLPAAVMVMPELFQPSDGLEPLTVTAVVAEFQERWGAILNVPPGVRRHHVTSGAIAGRVARQFATPSPLWSRARVHSLDIMIAAADPEAVTRGECQLVLERLRPATNVLEDRVFSEQHPDPARLLAGAEADYLDRRVYAIPRRESPLVTSRLDPPSALLSARYTYLCLGSESVTPPRDARVVPAAGLTLEVAGDGLVARYGPGGPAYPLLEVIGDMLAAVAAPAFRPLGAASHQPRVSIDALVIGRESWTFPVRAAAWAFLRDEGERYAAARRWRSSHGLPERVFVSLPGEDRPTAVDFRSLALTGLLVHAVRRAAKPGLGGFTVTEMLPDVDQYWLGDAAGDRYASELRFVAVDCRAPSPGPRHAGGQRTTAVTMRLSRTTKRPVSSPHAWPAMVRPGTRRQAANAPAARSKLMSAPSKSSHAPVSGNHAL